MARIARWLIVGVALVVPIVVAPALWPLGREPLPPPGDAVAITPATTTTAVPPVLVPWTGPVEHIFFHTLVIRPDLAFTSDRLGAGFRDYFVTVGEFRAILSSLDANGWTLVDIHRAVNGTVRVPPGRRPLVLSEDDVNYYDYERPRGLGWRLAVTGPGAVKVEVRDAAGTRVTDDDIVPIVDDFVASHPAFSADGAKGVLALTGYEGLFGERLTDAASVSRAKALAGRLRATGWTLASHSYGHIDLARVSTAWARQDTMRWLATASPVLGATDVYVYPFGSRPSPASRRMLLTLGFTVQCDIDVVPRLVVIDGVTVMARRHIDGIALHDQRVALASFFDARAVSTYTNSNSS